jgi:hypothetical protein
MDPETTSITNDGESDDVDIQQGGYFPSPGTTLTIRSLEPLNRSQLAFKSTPVRPSLLSASVVSSASSSSTASSTFDNNSSLAGTPLTPPLAGEPNPKDSLRSRKAGPAPISKLSLKEKAPQEIRSIEGTPSTAEAPTCTPQRRPATLEIQEQNGDLSAPGTDDGISSELDSPVAQKVQRVKRARNTPTDIDGIAKRPQNLGKSGNYAKSTRKSKLIHKESEDNYLRPSQQDVDGPSTPNVDDIDIFNDNNQYLGTFSAKIEIISQEISKAAQGQAAPKLQTSHKVHPVISPVSKPLKLGLEPEYTKRSKPSSTSHSDNIVVSTIQEQYQPDDGVSFPLIPKPASSSRRRSKSPRKQSNLSQELKDVPPPTVDPIKEHNPQFTTSEISKPTVQASNCDVPSPSETGNQSNESPSTLPIPQSASLSKSRKRKSRDLSTASAELRAAATTTAVLAVDSQPSRKTRSKTSVPPENASADDSTITESLDSAMIDCREDAVPESEGSPSFTQEESPLTDGAFKNYHPEELTSQKLKNKILAVLLRGDWEKKLEKSFMRKFTVLLDPHTQKRWFPDHPRLEKDDGFVYIFKSATDPRYLKIGKMKHKSPDDRIKQWSCPVKIPYRQVPDAKERSFRYYGLVESLVHAELTNERRKLTCTRCKRKNSKGEIVFIEHDEWFQTTEEHALEVVKKWRNWIIERRPYRWDGFFTTSGNGNTVKRRRGRRTVM